MNTVTLGRAGPEVSRAGLGLITLLDTGDFYGMGHSELLLAEALRGVRRDGVFIQVKFGAQRDPAGAFIGYDARPAAVKTALAHLDSEH
jgi:aryl-alcohol dehydrogenase-like predicted oxidoreductase